MARRFKINGCVFVAGLLSLAGPVQSATKVEARVSDQRVVEGQAITYEIRAEDGRIQAVTLRGLDDFERLSGPSTSHSMQIIDGVVTSISSYRWSLLPKRTGQLTIPAQTVTVDGRRLRTKPITIKVESARTAGQGRGGAGAGSLFIRAEVDHEEGYRGQQMTVTWTLYTRVSISGWEIVSLPNLTGFWTEELFAPNKLQLREEVIEGRRYYSAVVRRLALFPTQSGELEVDPLVLKIGVQSQRRRRRDPFFDDFSFLSPGRVENKVLASPTLKIDVKPIPTADRPGGYYGIVGDYTLSGGLDYREVEQDDAVTLTLIISGNGNTKTLEPPPIQFPRSLEVFDPKVKTEPSLGDIVGGTKTLEYVI
ncbi:MAG: BatD family protein, partial [Candidatus Neomarinimicrobiota bacterium]